MESRVEKVAKLRLEKEFEALEIANKLKLCTGATSAHRKADGGQVD